VVGVGAALLPTLTLTLTVDRPFILALRDLPTGSIVFLGRIVSP
jgi:serine protease inhibitor